MRPWGVRSEDLERQADHVVTRSVRGHSVLSEDSEASVESNSSEGWGCAQGFSSPPPGRWGNRMKGSIGPVHWVPPGVGTHPHLE